MVQTDSVLTAMLICAVQCLEIFKLSKWLIFQNPVTYLNRDVMLRSVLYLKVKICLLVSVSSDLDNIVQGCDTNGIINTSYYVNANSIMLVEDFAQQKERLYILSTLFDSFTIAGN